MPPVFSKACGADLSAHHKSRPVWTRISAGRTHLDRAEFLSTSPQSPRGRFSLKSGKNPAVWPLDPTAKSVRPPPLASIQPPGQPRGARSRGQSSRGGGSEPGELHLLAIELGDRVARKERAKRSKNGSPRARPAPRGAGQEGASRRPPIVPARPSRASERTRGTEARCRVL